MRDLIDSTHVYLQSLLVGLGYGALLVGWFYARMPRVIEMVFSVSEGVLETGSNRCSRGVRV